MRETCAAPRRRPPRVTVVRGGEVSFVDAALITIGDIVKLEQGDLVPADIRVLECSPNMCVDNSSLTGESDPIKRKPECTHSDPLETANLCFFGTQVPEGSCVGVVVKIADNTVRSPRFEVLPSTRVHLTMPWVVYFLILSEFGPHRHHHTRVAASRDRYR